jgi:hypothetical protein
VGPLLTTRLGFGRHGWCVIRNVAEDDPRVGRPLEHVGLNMSAFGCQSAKRVGLSHDLVNDGAEGKRWTVLAHDYSVA